MKKVISTILILAFIFSANVTAFADDIQSRAVIGADLNNDQISSVYSMFGIERSKVIELYLTNAE